jgi:hypothetical protein
MKLDGQLAISAFDLLFGGASFNAQDFIVIAFFSSHMTTDKPLRDLWDC